MFTIEKEIVVWPNLGQNPSLGMTAQGDLLALHTDLTDVMPGSRLFLRRSRDGGLTWTGPELTIESDLELGGVEGTLSCLGEICIICYAEGSDLKKNPNNPRLCKLIRSVDGGRSWSDPQRVNPDIEPVMPFGKIIKLKSSGELLLPAYWCPPGPERKATGGRSYVLASNDQGKNWQVKGHIDRDQSLDGFFFGETALLELPDGRLLAIMRGNAEGPGAVPMGFRSVSEDSGKTWSPAKQINVAICEPRLILDSEGHPLLVARSWPGNVAFFYRPKEPHELEPGANPKQVETVGARLLDKYFTPVREFGALLFDTQDEGQTWRPILTMQDPRGPELTDAQEPMYKHRYQAAYPDIQPLDENRYFVIFRQPDPNMPDIRPGLTYSHAFQRYVAGNIISRIPQKPAGKSGSTA